MNAKLTKTEKALAWFALVYGGFALVSPIATPLFSSQSPSSSTVIYLLVVGSIAVVAGYFCTVAKPWSFWLLAALFLPQCIEYFSESFFFSFIGPLPALKFGWGWHSPPSHINVNILAVCISLLSLRAALSLTGRSSGQPSAASAL
jgi:hypothetical protein